MRILLKESNGLAEWYRGQAIPTCGWAVGHRVPENHIFALLCGLCLTMVMGFQIIGGWGTECLQIIS